MLKIRLTKTGTKKKPKYKIVIAEEHSKRDGKFIEKLGSYDPTREPAKFEINLERFQYWRSVGAQSTKAVTNLVKRYERTSRVSS